jgi:hypothetical protein
MFSPYAVGGGQREMVTGGQGCIDPLCSSALNHDGVSGKASWR